MQVSWYTRDVDSAVEAGEKPVGSGTLYSVDVESLRAVVIDGRTGSFKVLGLNRVQAEAKAVVKPAAK